MKKEKTVKTYQRRTKSGKMVTVKQHTAKYDAAEKAKEAAKKKGAGEEFDVRKNASQMDIDIDEFLSGVKARSKEEREKLKESMEKQKAEKSTPKKTATKKTEKKSEPKTEKKDKSCGDCGFTASEFKEWYQGTGSAADKKVAKALKAKLGRAGYKKLEDEAIDNYTSRGHLTMFKRISSESGGKESPKVETPKKATKTKSSLDYDKLSKYKGDPAKLSAKERQAHQIITGNYPSEQEGKLRKQKSLAGLWEYVDSKKPKKESSKGVKDKVVDKFLDGKSIIDDVKNTTKTKKSEPKDYSDKIKQAHASLKAKGYKKYTLRGETYYATKSGSLKRVGSDGKIISGPVFRGAKMSQEAALKSAIADEKKKTKAKKDAAELKELRAEKKTSENKPKGKRGIKLTKPAKTTPTKDFSTTEKQVSYVRSLIKKLPEADRKELNSFARKASIGQISTDSLWKKYTMKKYPKGSKLRGSYAPWDKRAVSDMRNSE